jgi:hypothetical protein
LEAYIKIKEGLFLKRVWDIRELPEERKEAVAKKARGAARQN